MKKIGATSSRKTLESQLAYDAELAEFNKNRSLYMYIVPKQENCAFTIVYKTRYVGSSKLLPLAVVKRDEYIASIK